MLQLLKPYPNLKFVVQDRAEVLQQAVESVWPEQAPEALRNGRVSFMEHDFFMPNPVKGADVYWLRYILCAFPLLLLPAFLISLDTLNAVCANPSLKT